jgi:hypothetical protein
MLFAITLKGQLFDDGKGYCPEAGFLADTKVAMCTEEHERGKWSSNYRVMLDRLP